MQKTTTHKGLILGLLALAQFMIILDTSIVNVAIPSIYKALSFAPQNLQWVVTAYTLTFGGFLLLGGRAADLFGRKKVFLLGLVLFTIASLLSGLARNSGQLVAFRALQGLAAAFMSPAALSIVITTFKEGKERNKALSVWGAVAAGGAAAGLLLGGILTQYLDWRWNFFVNVPVGILVIAATYRYIPESKADVEHTHLDLPGAVLATAGLMTLVYTLVKASSFGWTNNKTIGLFAISAGLLIGFIINEKRSEHPLMPLSIFKIGNVAGANLSQLPIAAGLFSMFFFLSLYVQTVLGFAPVRTGFAFLPITIVIGITAGFASKLVGKVGYKKILVVAPLIIAAGLFVLSFIYVGGNYSHNVLPGLLIFASGMGFTFISVTIAATAGVPHNEAGLASGLLNTSQQIGGSLGLAILSSIAASKTANYIANNPNVHNLAQVGQVAGYQSAFKVAVVFMITGSLVALFVIKDIKADKTVLHAGL
jgi:EmrB/QacA subfamily drug resistance transporter